VPERSLRARGFVVVASLGGGLFALAAGTATGGGCTTHQCDGDCVVLDGPADPRCPAAAGGSSGGAPRRAWVDGTDIVWESSPPDGPWLDFPGQRTYWFEWETAFVQAVKDSPFAYLASNDQFWKLLPNPHQIDAYVADGPLDGADTRFVLASGQLAEMSSPSNKQLNVTNAACAVYALRVEVRVDLRPLLESDAGLPLDAGPTSPSPTPEGASAE